MISRPRPAYLAHIPVVRGLAPATQERLVEIIRFCIVGGMNWLVDFLVFNGMRALLPLSLVMVAKIVSVSAATLFSWVVNRSWTFAARATDAPQKELVGFVAVNLLGMLPPLACLYVSHHLMGLTSALADNISANGVGLVLGTILRYVGYRTFVFTGRRRRATPPHEDAQARPDAISRRAR